MTFAKIGDVVNRHPVWRSSSLQSGTYKAIWFDGDFGQPSWRMGEYTDKLHDEDFYKSVYRTNVYKQCPSNPISSTFGWLKYLTSNTYSNFNIEPATININCGKLNSNLNCNFSANKNILFK